MRTRKILLIKALLYIRGLSFQEQHPQVTSEARDPATIAVPDCLVAFLCVTVKTLKRISRRKALALCATPLFAQVRPRIAITMDDVRWQMIPEDRRAEAEERLLQHLGSTRAFLFAIGRAWTIHTDRQS